MRYLRSRSWLQCDNLVHVRQKSMLPSLLELTKCSITNVYFASTRKKILLLIWIRNKSVWTMANWTKFEGDGTQVQKSIMDLIQCKICCEIIENPKALPCLHTYCLDCLLEWTHGTAAKIICPECKESFVLPTQGVLGLPSNFFVAKLRELLEGPVTKLVNLDHQRHINMNNISKLILRGNNIGNSTLYP